MKSAKNRELINSLDRATDHMCYIGTRKVKLFLNSKVKQGDELAYIYRELLECETINANAKKYNNTYSFSYREMYYKRKHEQINLFIKHLIEHNPLNINFGYQESDVSDTKYILYIDVPNAGQISFHTDIDGYLISQVPLYTDEWDGLVNSTLGKLERAISDVYHDDLRKKYKGVFEEVDKKEAKKREENNKINSIIKIATTSPTDILSIDDVLLPYLGKAWDRMPKKDKIAYSDAIMRHFNFWDETIPINSSNGTMSYLKEHYDKRIASFFTPDGAKKVNNNIINHKRKEASADIENLLNGNLSLDGTIDRFNYIFSLLRGNEKPIAAARFAMKATGITKTELTKTKNNDIKNLADSIAEKIVADERFKDLSEFLTHGRIEVGLGLIKNSNKKKKSILTY